MNYNDMNENIMSNDHHARAQEILEESFDDIEMDGYLDYSDESEIVEEEEDFAEIEEPLNVEDDAEDVSVSDKDWINNGFGKKYDGEFDRKKAVVLFNTMEPNLEKNQMEAIRYATFFARHGINDAKNYIVSIIQHPEACASTEVHKYAQTSFFLFFRNYVRKSVEAFYEKQLLSGSDKVERYKDAQMECFTALLNNINGFDNEKGQLTTYFKNHILGALNTYEANRKGRKSKGTLSVDATVERCRQSLLRRGVQPNARLIALETGLSVNQVLVSLKRLEGENTSISADSEGGKYAAGKAEQSLFESPEKAYIANEQKSQINEMLEILTDTERAVLLAMTGLEQIGNTFIESEHDDDDSLLKISKVLGIQSNDVKRIYNDAVQKLRAANGIENSRDRLLSGRSMTFSKDKRDDIVDEYINDFSEIFDIEKYKPGKKYKKGDFVSHNNVFYKSLADENEAELSDEKFWEISSNSKKSA